MTLDARVYCDCFERGELVKPCPYPEHTRVSDDGSLELLSTTLEMVTRFDDWHYDSACIHENFTLIQHGLGDEQTVHAVKDELQDISERINLPFTILLEKILYDGTHSGDHLPLSCLNDLKHELDKLRDFLRRFPVSHELKMFRKRLAELAEASMLVQKPISF